ncbi:MAG: hypothetical protein FJ357_00465 [Thaumarchaeota archaeon]|nr:hypothetical protein [Nitrososphaerota archaeon]
MNIHPNVDTFFLSLLVGLAATLVMTVIEIPAWKRFGLRGVLEWHENQVLSTKFFRLAESELHVKGIFLLHFVNGGLGGIGFALALIVFPLAASSVILAGLAYGIFLWLVTLIPIHKPITGIIPWRHPDGNTPMITSLIGHLVYGVVTGLLFIVIW